MTQTQLALIEGTAAPAPSFAEPDPNTPAITEFADGEIQQRLRDFMAIHDDKPLDVLASAIRTACERGFGVWMVPDDLCKRPHHRPATHLIEIEFMACTGCGPTLIEATNSWRLAARHMLQQREA